MRLSIEQYLAMSTEEWNAYKQQRLNLITAQTNPVLLASFNAKELESYENTTCKLIGLEIVGHNAYNEVEVKNLRVRMSKDNKEFYFVRRNLSIKDYQFLSSNKSNLVVSRYYKKAQNKLHAAYDVIPRCNDVLPKPDPTPTVSKVRVLKGTKEDPIQVTSFDRFELASEIGKECQIVEMQRTCEAKDGRVLYKEVVLKALESGKYYKCDHLWMDLDVLTSKRLKIARYTRYNGSTSYGLVDEFAQAKELERQAEELKRQAEELKRQTEVLETSSDELVIANDGEICKVLDWRPAYIIIQVEGTGQKLTLDKGDLGRGKSREWKPECVQIQTGRRLSGEIYIVITACINKEYRARN